jgi:hypothetical protein
MTLRELAAAAGGVQYGSISAALRRFAERLSEESELREIQTKILSQISNNQMCPTTPQYFEEMARAVYEFHKGRFILPDPTKQHPVPADWPAKSK